MRRVTWNYIIDIIFGLLLLGQGVSGAVLWFLLPGGYRYRGSAGGGEAGSFLLARQDWRDIHQWLALALAIMFIVHIAIHWQWLVSMTKSYFRRGRC